MLCGCGYAPFCLPRLVVAICINTTTYGHGIRRTRVPVLHLQISLCADIGGLVVGWVNTSVSLAVCFCIFAKFVFVENEG